MVYYIPCPLCSIPLVIKKSRKERHFVTCRKCGIQMFINSEFGEKKLIEKRKKILEDKVFE